MAAATTVTRRLIYPSGGQGLADNWARLALLLTIGYLCATRSFAYLGLPWISLYVGEMALAAFLLSNPRTKQGRWLRVAWHTIRLRRFEWLLLLLLCYGALEALRGVLSGYPALTAARDTAFNYYPIFLFLGIWVGLRDRSFLQRAVRALAWWNGCYGLAYLLFLSRLPWIMPGTSGAASDVPVFGQPYGSAVALLGLIAFEPRLARVWHLLTLNAIVLLGVQVRSEWLALAVGLLVFAWCTKRFKHLVMTAILFVVLIGVMYITNIDLPSPEGRGAGRISAHYLVARAVTPFSPSLASDLAPSGAVAVFAGTADWRLVWWASIWAAVHGDVSRALFGFGYGYPIGDLNPFIEAGDFIQTPHNSFFYALGFSGWIGVMLFGLLQIELLQLVWRSYKITGQAFGLMFWSAMVAGSMFGPFFEEPYGAIPFYLLVGVVLAPALRARTQPMRRIASNLRVHGETI